MDPRGRFAFDGLRPGRYELRCGPVPDEWLEVDLSRAGESLTVALQRLQRVAIELHEQSALSYRRVQDVYATGRRFLATYYRVAFYGKVLHSSVHNPVGYTPHLSRHYLYSAL